MKTLYRAVSLLVLGLLVLGVATPAHSLGKFIESDATGRLAVDPILYRGVAASPHTHLFLGSTALLSLPHPEDAEYADLVGQGTLLDNPDDTAAYWVPDLVYVATGQPVEFKRYFAYYRGFDGQNTGSTQTQAYPADMRLVTGDATGRSPAPLNKINWNCDDRSSRPGPYPNIVSAHCDQASGQVFLTAHIAFESCWDGVLSSRDGQNTSDSAHTRYPKNGACPQDFPIKLPLLRETIKWDYQGSGQDVALSSDLMQRHMGNPVQAGSTLHADFWNTWVQTGGLHGGLEGMVQSCIRANNPAEWCNA